MTPSPPAEDAVDRLRALAPPGRSGLGQAIRRRLLLRALGVAADDDVRIGRFVIREPLGRGGMGDVFRAHDPALERDVALKVLDRTLELRDPETVRREARALARLNHPNVLAVYELGLHDEQVFVAMEFVPGRTLGEHARRQPPPTWQELVGLGIQAGMGLLAAHEAGLVHRDVKPDNLLVREDGRVVVADFGLARPGEDVDPDLSGTPGFQAPEVLAHGVATEASDQYAYCATLWRLLDPVAAPGGDSTAIPPAVRHALARGLATAPDARWPSMRELIAALRDSLDLGPDAHHRAVLLDRVEQLWVEGVLRSALREAAPVPLTLSDASSRVDPPWGRRAPAPEDRRSEASGKVLARRLAHAQGSLLILGEPGAGKTLLLLRLAEELLERARLDPAAPAPVVLHLAAFATWRGTLDAWVEHELVTKYNLPRAHVTRWLESGALVLLLDGLDEVPAPLRGRTIDRLDAFRAAHGIALVVTSRTAEQDSTGARLRFGAAVAVDPLPPEVVWGALGPDAPPDAAVPPDALRTPLLLALLRAHPGGRPAGEALVPWLVEQHLAHAFAARGVGAAREQELRAGLGFLARASLDAGRSEIWVEEIDPDTFLSPTAARAARALAVVLLVLTTVTINVGVSHLVEDDAFSGLVFGLCSAPMVLAFNRGLRAQPVERLRFSWRRLVRLAPLALALGTTAGAIYGLFYVVWNNVIFGAAAALVTLLTISFEPSLREGGLRPNQGIRQSAYNGLAIGLLGLVAASVTFGLVVVPAVLPYLDARSTLVALPHPGRTAAAVAGPMIGVIAGMVQGGWAVLAHASTRLVLAATTPLPLRLVAFLDEAVDLALLRRIGGGYLYPHRTFQEALATFSGTSGRGSSRGG